MKTYCKNLFSVALAPLMSVLLVNLIFSTGRILVALLLVHILTLIVIHLLHRKDCCRTGALYIGFFLAELACFVHDYSSGSEFLQFLMTYIVTAFYTLPALLLIKITDYFTKR